MKVKVQPITFVKTEADRKELKNLRLRVKTLNAALESAYEHQEVLFQEKRDVERKLVETEQDFKSLKHRFADVCAERDNMTAAYKQLEFSLIEQQKQFAQQHHEQEEKACDTYSELYAEYVKQKNTHKQEISGLIDALTDRNARVDELEKANDELRQTVEALKNKAAAHREEKGAFEDIIQSFNETRKEYEAEIARVCREKQDLYARLEDTQNDFLTQKALVVIYKNTIADRDKTIEGLRKQLEEPTARFYDFLVEHNLIKTETELGGGNIHETEH